MFSWPCTQAHGKTISYCSCVYGRTYYYGLPQFCQLCPDLCSFDPAGFLFDLHCFHVSTGAWTELFAQGGTPSKRAGLGLTELDGALFVFGGHNMSGKLSFQIDAKP